VSRPRAESGPCLLLLADPLQREGLTQWLRADPKAYCILSARQPGDPSPQLVIWSLALPLPPERLEAEAQHLLDRWQPAPVLLLLPPGHSYPTPFLLGLPVQGVLDPPEAEPLRAAVATLLAGGRVVEIPPGASREQAEPSYRMPLGLGQWLLASGLAQIEAELRTTALLLEHTTLHPLTQLLVEGRRRELLAARGLLLWLWGPLQMAWGSSTWQGSPSAGASPVAFPPTAAGGLPGEASAQPGFSLTLRQRSADGIWEVLRERLQQAAGGELSNRSGALLALDGLHSERRRDLLLALLEQFEQLRGRLQQQQAKGEALVDTWQELQPELRRQALRRMAGSYVQLPDAGVLRPVADTLVRTGSFQEVDPELPDPMAMLATLLQARPLLVDGRLLGPDEPQAVLYLEMLLANWLIRNAELISAEVLAACAGWPELRRYLLRPDLLATRNLERLRNQLNAQQRWSTWFHRPVQLYESRRPLFRLEAGAIDTIQLTEPRDQELRQLPWLQQLVTLMLEARDALAPQLQSLVRSVGDLVVVLLTQVVGRGIGLVGRGIAQGMGRSLSRGERS
jgi:hypothetical protein